MSIKSQSIGIEWTVLNFTLIIWDASIDYDVVVFSSVHIGYTEENARVEDKINALLGI